jgi:aspartate carbamoyltransferase regulatory subunit
VNPPVPKQDRRYFKGIYREECCSGLRRDNPVMPSMLAWFCGIAMQKYRATIIDLQVSPNEEVPSARYYVISVSAYTLKDDLAITRQLKATAPKSKVAVILQPPVLEDWVKQNYPIDYVIGLPRPQNFKKLFGLKHDAISAYHLLNLKKYGVTPIYNGIGCPFSCIFCAWSKTRHYYRKTEFIITESLYVADESSSEVIYFIDPNTLFNLKWSIDFAKKIGNRFKWHIDARADRNEIELLRQLKDNGCVRITYGLETPEVQKVKKSIKLEDVLTAAKNCDQVGVHAHFTTLFGFPWDSWETQRKHKAFLKKILISDSISAGVAFPIPHPNTILYQMVKEKLAFSNPVEMYDAVRYKNRPCFATDHLSIPELQKAYEDIYYFVHRSRVGFFLKNFKVRYLRHIPYFIKTKLFP